MTKVKVAVCGNCHGINTGVAIRVVEYSPLIEFYDNDQSSLRYMDIDWESPTRTDSEYEGVDSVFLFCNTCFAEIAFNGAEEAGWTLTQIDRDERMDIINAHTDEYEARRA